ncbi:MAG: tripartite tricarboxylate transporter substrate binding protein [Rhodovarius sp.]|nr:tripartite tricarboxylate transporter substrate binding protein [Rhodovarius sp.]
MILRRSILALPALAAPALAQPAGWPDRPIVFVSPFLPGGSTDIIARIIADRVAPRLGPQARIIVENRAGAGGSIGSEWVRQRPPDGYTWLLASASSHGTNPAALPHQTPYDPVDGFTHLAVLGDAPLVVGVPANSRFRTLQELIAFARAHPGRLSWGSSGAGGIGHLAGEYLRVAAGGFQAEYVPYRGGSQVAEALTKAEIDFAMEVLASAAPTMRANLSRGLAVTGSERHPLFPDIPTVAESGLPGYEIRTWNTVAAPRGMDLGLARHINAALNEVLREPQTVQRLEIAGLDPRPGSTVESTRQFVADQVALFRDIVQRAGLRIGRQ